MKIDKQIIFGSPVASEGKVYWWEPPEIPNLSGPSELANLLQNYRQRLSTLEKETGEYLDSIGDISDAAIMDLLMVAYKASFLTNENRPVLARFFVKNKKWKRKDSGSAFEPLFASMDEYFNAMAIDREKKINVHRFIDPLPLSNAKLVSKLAPILATDDSALIIEEREGKLLLLGVGLLDDGDWERSVLRMPGLGRDRSGLVIEILGPGHLVISEGRNKFTLNATEILVQESAWVIDPVRKWLIDVSIRNLKIMKENLKWDDESLSELMIGNQLEYVPQMDVWVTWSRILREARRLRHGGTFVILPDIQSTNISIGIRTRPLSILDEIRNCWEALRDLKYHKPQDDILGLVEEKQKAIHHLLSTSKSIAALSATDGCVVLDRELVVHGFSASIKSGDNIAKNKEIWHLQKGGFVNSADLLSSFGERHRSAFNICSTVPHAMAFVISQDGDLRLFCSSDTQVQFADQLFA